MKTIVAILLFWTALAWAHGGGLDSLGCHNDRKAGLYHCHRGPLAGKTFANKAEAQKALADLEKPKPSSAIERDGRWVVVTRIIDGDTAVLADGVIVRLLGIDAPELRGGHQEHCPGTMASAALREMIEGKEIWLGYDAPKNDRYGRTLAFIYLSDGTNTNLEMVRLGYARAYLQFPFRYSDLFSIQQNSAKSARRGLWSAACAM
jgi:endonuclease YncB( thermonuclease family)